MLDVDVTVAVATFGRRGWVRLALERAIPSATAQGVPVVHVHSETLAQARNQALARVQTEWVCHLDADDELEPGYFDAMAAASADVRAPAVRYVHDGTIAPAALPVVAGHTHPCTADCLPAGNWLIIGSLVRAQLVRDVGGWRDYTWSEDWDVWLRCHLAGATFAAVPAAVYRAHVSTDSRNRRVPQHIRQAVHDQIHRDNYPP